MPTESERLESPLLMTLRHPMVLLLVSLAFFVVMLISSLLVSDKMRRQRSIERRDQMLELVHVGMPTQDAIEILRAEGFRVDEHGFRVDEHDGNTVSGSSPYVVVTIDRRPHLIRSLAYSMDMSTEGIGPVKSVVLFVNDDGNIERIK